MTPKHLIVGSGLAFLLIWGTQEIQSVSGDRAVQSYINETARTPEQQSAAHQLVNAMESVFDQASSTTQARDSSRSAITDAINCIYATFPSTGRSTPAEVSHQIEQLMLFNRERKLAYTQLNADLSGTTWNLPDRDTCH